MMVVDTVIGYDFVISISISVVYNVSGDISVGNMSNLRIVLELVVWLGLIVLMGVVVL